jgi:hypothetical protein
MIAESTVMGDDDPERAPSAQQKSASFASVNSLRHTSPPQRHDCDHAAMADLADPGDVRMWDLAQERYTPAPSTGRPLVIDVEKARAVVHELEKLAEEIAEQAKPLTFRKVTPPGFDDVSLNVARQSDRMLSAARAYLLTWREDVVAATSALRSQIDAYEATDLRNTARS